MQSNPLSNLTIDYWYKAMLVVSTVLLILALTVDIAVIGNLALLQLSFGSMLISIGEWINHPRQEHIVWDPTMTDIKATTTAFQRNPVLLGNLFDILGFIFLILGCISVYSRFMHS